MTISAAMEESGEPMGKPDICLKKVPRRLNAELAEQVRSPISNWYQGILTCGWIWVHLSLMPLIAVPIWTFVKSEAASSEIILCPGGIVTFIIFWLNSKLFFTREIGGVMIFEIILLRAR